MFHFPCCCLSSGGWFSHVPLRQSLSLMSWTIVPLCLELTAVWNLILSLWCLRIDGNLCRSTRHLPTVKKRCMCFLDVVVKRCSPCRDQRLLFWKNIQIGPKMSSVVHNATTFTVMILEVSVCTNSCIVFNMCVAWLCSPSLEKHQETQFRYDVCVTLQTVKNDGAHRESFLSHASKKQAS